MNCKNIQGLFIEITHGINQNSLIRLFNAISKINSLISLHISLNINTRLEGIETLARLTNLQSLKINHQVYFQIAKFLLDLEKLLLRNQLKNLRFLELDAQNITGDKQTIINFLSAMKNTSLTRIKIKMHISKDVEHERYLLDVDIVFLENNNLELVDKDLEKVKKGPGASFLNIFSLNKMKSISCYLSKKSKSHTKEALCQIIDKQYDNLKQISLNVNCDSVIFEKIFSISKLQSLELQISDIDDNFWDAFINLNQLTNLLILDISIQSSDDYALEMIFNNLKDLVLLKSFKIFILPENRKIKKINESILTSFIDSIKCLTQLSKFGFSISCLPGGHFASLLSDTFLCKLFKQLKNMPLEELLIYAPLYPKPNNEPFNELGTMIKQLSKTLNSLELCFPEFTLNHNEGVFFANSIKTAINLKTLSLNFPRNPFEDKTFEYFIKSISYLSKLNNLTLHIPKTHLPPILMDVILKYIPILNLHNFNFRFYGPILAKSQLIRKLSRNNPTCYLNLQDEF